MAEKKNKLKVWFEEHKTEVIIVAYGVGSLALGLCLGNLIGTGNAHFRDACEVKVLHDNGIIKFFDPTNGLEVKPEEAIDVVRKLNI